MPAFFIQSFVMQPRTRRQKEVLEYIKQYVDNHGYDPSYQQIARHLGVSSKAGIAKHIEALENQGLLTRSREFGTFKLEINSTKSVLELIREIQWLDIPDTSENREEWEKRSLFIPSFLVEGLAPEKVRAFRVRDEAMLEEQICDGDVALIEIRPYPRDGEIVVALLEDKTPVLHKYFRAGSNIELRPANIRFDTIIVGADKIELVGVMRGILRPMV